MTRPAGWRIDVDVPVNTRAEVHVPLADGQQALESRQARQHPARRDLQGHDQRRRGLRGRLRQLPLPGRDASMPPASTRRSPAPSPRRSRSRSHRRRFGAFTPGLAKDYTADAHRRRSPAPPAMPRSPSTTRAPPRPATWSTAASRSRSRCRSRARPVARREQPDPAKSWTGAGQQRPADARAQAVRRRQRRAAHRQLREDADVHAEHHGPVEPDGSPPWPRSAWPRRPVP